MSTDLMVRAQAGDLDAFGELYAAYRNNIFCLAKKYHPDLAEDITQDVFVKALAKVGSWRDQGKPPLAWLYTICANVCHDRARSAHVRLSTPLPFVGNSGPELPEAARSAEDLVVDELQRRELLAAIAKLSPDQQQVIVLFHYKHLSGAGIAELLGIDAAAVKSRLYRARRALARLLAESRVAA